MSMKHSHQAFCTTNKTEENKLTWFPCYSCLSYVIKKGKKYKSEAVKRHSHTLYSDSAIHHKTHLKILSKIKKTSQVFKCYSVLINNNVNSTLDWFLNCAKRRIVFSGRPTWKKQLDLRLQWIFVERPLLAVTHWVHGQQDATETKKTKSFHDQMKTNISQGTVPHPFI